MTPRKVMLTGLGMMVLGIVIPFLFIAGVLTVVAGGIFALVQRGKPSTPATGQSSSSSPAARHVAGWQPDLAAKLTQLAHLNATGALNDQEYGAAKQRAIAGD